VQNTMQDTSKMNQLKLCIFNMDICK